MPDGALHLHPDAEIYREHRGPGWGLRCCSIDCGDASWLVDWAADEWHALGTRTDVADLAERERYANDPAVLVAVTATSNRAKGDQDPARWLPALDRCGYVARWT
ncbi:hypothetical protein AB0M82_37025, partial [Amycolatopsis sp. NPDC051128]